MVPLLLKVIEMNYEFGHINWKSNNFLHEFGRLKMKRSDFAHQSSHVIYKIYDITSKSNHIETKRYKGENGRSDVVEYPNDIENADRR